MIRLLRKVPWWAWLALPGGLVLAVLAKRSQSGTGDVHAPVTHDSILAAAQAATLNAIDKAKSLAATLRQNLQNDPLAAAQLGIPQSLLVNADPASVASNQAQADALKAAISGLESQVAADKAAYSRDHNGGQSQQQEQSLEGGLEAQIAADQSELSGLTNVV